MLPRYGIFTEELDKNSYVHKRGMSIPRSERNPPQRYFYRGFGWSQIRYLSSTNVTIIPGWPKKKVGTATGAEKRDRQSRMAWCDGAQTRDKNVTVVTRFPFWGGSFGRKYDETQDRDK